MTKISASEIKNSAAHIRTEVEFLNGVIKRMDEVKEDLSHAWTDSTTQNNAKKYLENVEEKQVNLKAIIDKIGELPDKLDKAADSYNVPVEGGQI